MYIMGKGAAETHPYQNTFLHAIYELPDDQQASSFTILSSFWPLSHLSPSCFLLFTWITSLRKLISCYHDFSWFGGFIISWWVWVPWRLESSKLGFLHGCFLPLFSFLLEIMGLDPPYICCLKERKGLKHPLRGPLQGAPLFFFFLCREQHKV